MNSKKMFKIWKVTFPIKVKLFGIRVAAFIKNGAHNMHGGKLSEVARITASCQLSSVKL
jgi:hypothetical protein